MHEQELAEHPPAEYFLAEYFRAQGWWEPPGAEDMREVLPESDLPEFEP